MRGGLNTDLRAERTGSVLSGPVFSQPHDCAHLVNCLQPIGVDWNFQALGIDFDVSGAR